MEKVFLKLELINDIPITMLEDPAQRELYKQQLRNEIARFKAKEHMYETKRTNL